MLFSDKIFLKFQLTLTYPLFLYITNYTYIKLLFYEVSNFTRLCLSFAINFSVTHSVLWVTTDRINMSFYYFGTVLFFDTFFFFFLLSHLLVLFLKNSICVFRSLFFLYFNMGGTGFATSERFRHSPALKLRFSLRMVTVIWNKHWSSVSETNECSELWPQGTSRGDLENSQSYGMLTICICW